MPQIIYFDEAGYTGPDMMNADQPVFAVSSHNLQEADAQRIITDCFADFQGDELKYAVLRRSARGRRNLIRMFQALQERGVIVHNYVVEKPFALCIKLLDVFTETALFGRGVNLYEGHFNIVLANQVYYDLREGLGKRDATVLMNSFQRMMRQRSEQSYKEFWRELSLAKEAANPQAAKALNVLAFGSEMSVADYLALPDDTLDLSFTVVLALISEWQRALDGRFCVIHDQSTNLEGRATIFDRLTDPALTPEVIGQGDNRDFELPFRIDSFTFAPSQDHAALQIADCCAGAIAEVTKLHLGERCEEAFANQLLEVGYDSVSNNMLLDTSWRPPAAANVPRPTKDMFIRLAQIMGG